MQINNEKSANYMFRVTVQRQNAKVIKYKQVVYSPLLSSL